MTLGDLLVSTVGASLWLVILDACRNNPLARPMQRTAATRSVSGGSFADLNEDLLGDETLVAYAAAAPGPRENWGPSAVATAGRGSVPSCCRRDRFGRRRDRGFAVGCGRRGALVPLPPFDTPLPSPVCLPAG